MSSKPVTKRQRRERRSRRVRARIRGTAQRPRLNVFRSSKQVFAQLVDDDRSNTLVSAHSREVKGGKADVGGREGKVADAYLVGKILADKAKKLKIGRAVFDRAGYKYHGRVRAVAEGARDNGLAL